MSPVTRRTFAFGAAMVLAASAFAAPAAAQDEPPMGGTAVAGEWQAATQLNPFIPNAVKDCLGQRRCQVIWEILVSRPVSS